MRLDLLTRDTSKLLRSEKESDLVGVHELYKRIKKEFKSNIKNLMSEIGDVFNSGDTSHQCETVGRTLELSAKTRPLLCPDVNTDEYTKFMESLQPPTNVPRVQATTFMAPNAMRNIIRIAIERFPKSRLPCPDKVRLEMLSVQPEVFTDVHLHI